MEADFPGSTGPRGDARRCLALGALVPAGWLIHDLQRYCFSRDPAAFVELVPGSLAIVTAGAGFGLLAAWSRWIPIGALLVTGIFAVRHRLLDVPYTVLGAWMPRVAFVLVAAFLAARLGAAWKLGVLRSGLASGFAAAAVTTMARGSSVLLWQTLAAAAVVLLLGRVPAAWLRRAATAAVLALPVYSSARPAWKSQRLARPDEAPPPVAAPAGAPNLLLIVLDTVRADRLAPYGYERVTTPRIDAFVGERATRYTRARSAGTFTLPSHGSLFTGLYPSEHGADHPRVEGVRGVQLRDNRPTLGLRPDVPTLAGVLKQHGWRTAAFVANNAFLHHAYGLDRGFERYDDRDAAWTGSGYLALAQYAGFELRTGHVPYRDGGRITRRALQWIDGIEDQPFFLMLNYMDAHQPYIPQEPRHAASFSDAQPREPLVPEQELWPLLYDRCLLDLDRHVGDLIDGLERRALVDGTAIIITSDHGEGLGDHHHWDHGLSLYEELIHVPLYVAPPRGRERAEDDTPLSGIAIPHLATRLLGLEAWPTPDSSRHVATEWHPGSIRPGILEWAALNGRDPAADVLAWVEGEVKFIVAEDGKVEAYDLVADPLELAPLALTPERREAALARARQWWAEHPPVQAADVELDEERLEVLGALGYLDG